jgi:cardiolipin synthase
VNLTLTLPNLLSILRLGLVPVFVIAVLDGRSLEALLIMGVAGLTDALDGYFARSLHQQSLLGSYLDPIADKLLLTSAYVTLAFPHLPTGVIIPVWVTVLVLARDVTILGLALVLFLATGIRRFPPSKISKVTTVVQVLAILLVLVSGLDPRAEGLARGCLWLVAGFTVTSGLQYGFRVARMTGEDSVDAGSG